MRTTHHPTRHALPRVGIGLLLAGLSGGMALPAASAAGVELSEYQNDREYQNPLGAQDAREQNGRRDYRHDPLLLRELGYGLPDRYTIYKGQTCELRCERIRRSREYTCRAYRC
jgi:hypothetical protein